MILTETNITNQSYCRNRLGYDVICLHAIMVATGGAQGRRRWVLVVRYRSQDWSIALTRFHGPNMVIYKVVSG